MLLFLRGDGGDGGDGGCNGGCNGCDSDGSVVWVGNVQCVFDVGWEKGVVYLR